MSEPNQSSFVRNNWHLLLVFVAVVAAIPIVAMRERTQEAAPETSTGDMALATGETMRIVPLEPRETSRDAAAAIIESHRRQLEANPKSDDAPALLVGMGNLYRQKLSDYEQAAACFERLLDEYPDSINIREAYLQLVICYERLGDEENRRRILRRMMNDFPPESEEYLYAAQELGL